MDLYFSVTSGLKSIIGSDLIQDDFIAVFELVKNSFDAHASKVKLIFGDDKIIIWDNGKGMTFDDIQNKWLRVAYSAKKEGEEDNELKAEEYKDYRDRIIPAKYFAGAKGIGRFSSDRLGEKVLLTARKASTKATYEQLSINWGDFDLDPKKKFEKIKIKRIDKPIVTPYPKFTHGAILEISGLRSSWPRKKLLDLKHSLEKLINPFDSIDQKRKTTVSKSKKFIIEIVAPAEISSDKTEEEPRDKINGPVGNFVFETLGLKTTQIFTEVSADGKFITTQLEDRGQLIYRIRERNTEFRQLSDVRMHLFYLNFAAKHNFKRQMGVESVKFGSLFLYKNDFRIYPFGEEGANSFGIDRRKQQGYARFLGSREIIGRIELFGNDNRFQETSSRDGGLIRTPAYMELEECFMKKCLLRLERYVVDISWFLKEEDSVKEDLSAIQHNLNAKTKIVELINKLVDTDKVVLEEYAKDFLSLMDEKIQEVAEVPKAFEALEKLGSKTKDADFVKQVKRARRDYELLRKKKDKADQKAREEEEATQAALDELALEKQKSTYLLATRKTLSEDAEGLIHNIVITTKSINANVDTLIEKIRSGTIKEPEILKRLSAIKYNVDKTQKIGQLITRANFRTQAEKQITDIAKYVEQYCAYYNDIYEKDQLSIKVVNHKAALTKKVNILELSMIFDNLISNTEKASAKNVLVDIKNNKSGHLVILFSDDGKGVDENLQKNIEKIFELGITTTDGSGIGLNHVKEGLGKINGDIRFVENKGALRGATFEIIIQ
jgi:signal transduction histidine kinase